jgi:hypothetical protein
MVRVRVGVKPSIVTALHFIAYISSPLPFLLIALISLLLAYRITTGLCLLAAGSLLLTRAS